MNIVERMTDNGIDVRVSELFDQSVELIEVGPWIVGLIDDRLIVKRHDDVAVID